MCVVSAFFQVSFKVFIFGAPIIANNNENFKPPNWLLKGIK